MKRPLTTLLAVAALSLGTAIAGETTLTSAQGIPIRGLQAGSTFAVTLRQSDQQTRNGVKVTIDERLEPYLKVTLEHGILILGFQELPRDLQRSDKWCCTPTAEVTLSRLDRLSASGMANIRPEGNFSGSAVAIHASGSSKIGPLTVTVTGNKVTEVNTSGMSRIDATLKGAGHTGVKATGSSRAVVNCGAVTSLTVETSGMSSAAVTGSAPSTHAKASGSSTLKLDCGAIRNLDASTSGMSSLTATGRAEKVDATASGSSHIDLKGLEAKNVSAETSGMSGITAWVTESLEAEASGSSSVRYRTKGRIHTDLRKSGMGSIARIE